MSEYTEKQEAWIKENDLKKGDQLLFMFDFTNDTAAEGGCTAARYSDLQLGKIGQYHGTSKVHASHGIILHRFGTLWNVPFWCLVKVEKTPN